MSNYRFHKAPAFFGRGANKRDNVVLAPASRLAFKAQWQKVANSLPQGGVLVVLPSASKQRESLEQVAEEIRKLGRNVKIVSA
jgi:hypothetical protein